MTVPSFGLRVFEAGGISVPTDIVCDIAPSVKKAYAAEAEKALAALSAMPIGAPEALLKGRRHTAERIRAALDAGAYATLRHLLLSYHTRLALSQNRELCR